MAYILNMHTSDRILLCSTSTVINKGKWFWPTRALRLLFARNKYGTCSLSVRKYILNIIKLVKFVDVT